MGTLPTIRVIGPKGLAIINVSDLELYLAKGFKTEAEVEAEAKAKAKSQSPLVSVVNLTVPELRKYAEENGIDLSDLTKKADIVAAIGLAIEKPEGESDEAD